MISRDELKSYLTQLLKPYNYSDYGPNGLQIEGQKNVSKIAFAVSATKDSIEKTIEQGADTLIVHHGLFWNFHGVRTITGSFAKRVIPLIQNEVNLFGYHLPLDAHPEIGNAATLAKQLELSDLQPFGDHKGSPTGVKGNLPSTKKVQDVTQELQKILSHNVLVSAPKETETISSLGIITGGANGGWLTAAKEGLDAYLTGEMSEHDWNEAKEEGVVMFAGGHHATEKLGIQSLMKEVSKTFQIESFFIDSDNPA